MSELVEISRVSNAENYEELRSARSEEIKKIHKLELLLSIVKKAKINQMDDVEDKPGFSKSIKTLCIQNYLKLNDAGNLLGLDKSNVQFSYSEKKAIRKYIMENVPKVCDPVLNYVNKIQEHSPGIFDESSNHSEFFELEEERRKLTLELLECKNRKCELLKLCAEMKLGPYLKNDLEIVCADYKLNQLKVNTLQKFIEHEILSRTDHTVKAVKEVEGYIDGELENLAPM